jgi:hypothetical protein
MNTVAFLILMGLLKGQGSATIWSNIMTVGCFTSQNFIAPLTFARKQFPLLWLVTRFGQLRPSSASASFLFTAALSF